MREILFRGKRLDNGEWMQGDLLHDPDLGGVTISWFGYDVFEHGIERWETSESVVPETVGQYTGLTDKNGKKIFEGDVVFTEFGSINEEDGNAVIEWDKKTACFVICWGGIISDFDSFYGHDLEIVGNIHDNPELLKGD